MMIIFKLREAVDKALREEQCGFRKGKKCVDQIFTLRSIIMKCLSYQTPLVLSLQIISKRSIKLIEEA
jgi:hypothetical protein